MFFFLFSLSFLTLFHSGFSATAEEGTSKKRVVILAGMIKTGSSAAQRMLHFNRQKLKEQGVSYPHEVTEKPGKEDLRFYQNVYPARVDVESLCTKASSTGCLTLLLSSENFFRVPNLSKPFLRFVDTTVVVAVRDFYPHIWSIYQEFMKWTKGSYMTFEEYVAEGALFKKKDHYDNLFDFMRRYPNVKFEFFNFDKHRAHIVDTLLEKGHLPLDLTGFDRLDQDLVNRALTASEHHLITFLWKQGVSPDKRRDCIDAFYKATTEGVSYKLLVRPILEEMYAKHRALAERINTYLVEEEHLLTEAPQEIRGFVEEVPLEIQETDWEIVVKIIPKIASKKALLEKEGFRFV